MEVIEKSIDGRHIVEYGRHQIISQFGSFVVSFRGTGLCGSSVPSPRIKQSFSGLQTFYIKRTITFMYDHVL
jgi:hypothetical protein